MRFSILTLGTRGDVQPYIALSKELISRGHEVVICTGESFQDIIIKNGIEFYKAHSDLMSMLNTPEGKAVMSGGLKNFKAAMAYAKNVVNPAFRKTLDDFWEASKKTDAIIYHPKALAAPDICVKLNILCISMPPVPITYPISEFPCLAISANKNFGKAINKLTYKFMKIADASSMKEINDFRIKTLNLPKRKAGIYAYKINNKEIPIIYPISSYLFKDVHSWNDKVFLPGFFFLNDHELNLSPEIIDFINKGNKPIAISFSSMPLKNPDFFKQNLLKALKLSGDRTIVLTGNSEIYFENEPEIFCTKEAPHTKLFPLCKGVVHHGGVGTTASALYSGIPQQIIPFSVDQPFWASRLFKLGYALKPLYETSLNYKDLANAFINMSDKNIISKSKEISNMIINENGVKRAVDYIENIMSNF